MDRNGRLISVVGVDGAGKTTQVAQLAEWLEGGGNPALRLLNQTMLPVRQSLDAIAEEDGYSGHLDMIGADSIRLISACAKLAALAPVREALKTPNMTVLVDRYTYCQYAAVRFQKADNEDFLRRLNRVLPESDLAIFLDVRPEIAQERILKRGIDEETIEFLVGLRDAYRSLPEFKNFVVVDGNGTMEEVQERLRAEILKAFPELEPSRSYASR